MPGGERSQRLSFSRTKAKKAHPDVGGTEEQMAALNEAYEVLSNQGGRLSLTSLGRADATELRQRYDNGDDPNDPTGGQGGNPFAHHSGGGMPFQFFQQGGFQGFPGGGGRKMQFQWGM